MYYTVQSQKYTSRVHSFIIYIGRSKQFFRGIIFPRQPNHNTYTRCGDGSRAGSILDYNIIYYIYMYIGDIANLQPKMLVE